MAIKILAGIAKDGTNEGARVSAAVALLDRGWGKPTQAHTGTDGEGDIQITVRTFVEGVGGHAGETATGFGAAGRPAAMGGVGRPSPH